jgi:hypothetical protein
MKTDNFIMNILYIMGSITGMMMIGKLLGLLVGLSWWIVDCNYTAISMAGICHTACTGFYFYSNSKGSGK